MIGYYTDNPISKAVMAAFSRSGTTVSHINNFQFNKSTPAIFYGILRGTGAAMRYLQFQGKSFHYIDNGYFDAVYMDERKAKEMTGKYRVVNSDMIEPMDILPVRTATGPMRILMYPPSTYAAFMYDTTPEDWTKCWRDKLLSSGHEIKFADKIPGWSFDSAIDDCDALFTFNSTTVIRAMELGKSVFTTHGIIRNADMSMTCAPHYDVEAVKEFYAPKQFTLDEISQKGIKCLA